MLIDPRLREALSNVETHGDLVEVDKVAFILAHAHVAKLLDGTSEVESFPRLRLHFNDCLKDVPPAIIGPRVLLMLQGERDREDRIGRVADLIVRNSV